MKENKELTLHDCTLKDISFDWSSGKLMFNIDTWDHEKNLKKSINLIALEVKSISVPREFPWGPSTSINSAMIEQSKDVENLSIEMQSGDLIRVVCKKIILET